MRNGGQMAAYNVAFRIRRCMALAFIALTTAAPHSIFAKEAAALSLSPEEAVKYALDGKNFLGKRKKNIWHIVEQIHPKYKCKRNNDRRRQH